jgi:hypothetical protein
MGRRLSKIETLEDAKKCIKELRSEAKKRSVTICRLRTQVENLGKLLPEGSKKSSIDKEKRLQRTVKRLQEKLRRSEMHSKGEQAQAQKLRVRIVELEEIVRQNTSFEGCDKDHEELTQKLARQDELLEQQAQQIRELESARDNAGFITRLRSLAGL